VSVGQHLDVEEMLCNNKFHRNSLPGTIYFTTIYFEALKQAISAWRQSFYETLSTSDAKLSFTYPNLESMVHWPQQIQFLGTPGYLLFDET